MNTESHISSTLASIRPPRIAWPRRLLLWAIGGALLWLVFAMVLAGVVHIYGVRDDSRVSDTIVVLGAGLRRDGAAGPALTRRTLHAAQLYREGLAPRIICSGGHAEPRPRSEAAACAEILQRQGIPDSAIILEDRSRSTEENAMYTREIMDANGWTRALVVSDSFHMLRAQWIFSAYGIEFTPGPVLPDQIRSTSTYLASLSREVLALHWQFLKSTLNLPITYVGGL